MHCPVLLNGENMFETALKEAKVTVISNNPIRVMHVDDDAAFLCMAKQCLEMQGEIEVDSAQSVKEAFEMLKTKKFDVIVSDYQMSGKDGLEFLDELKSTGNATPFILFSGKGRDEVAVKALNSGAFRYVDKRGARRCRPTLNWHHVFFRHHVTIEPKQCLRREKKGLRQFLILASMQS